MKNYKEILVHVSRAIDLSGWLYYLPCGEEFCPSVFNEAYDVILAPDDIEKIEEAARELEPGEALHVDLVC